MHAEAAHHPYDPFTVDRQAGVAEFGGDPWRSVPHYDHRDGFTMHRPDQGARDNRAFWEAANRVTIPEQANDLNGLLDQVLHYLRADTVVRSVDCDSDLDRLPSSPTR